ncbi:hypothetical protein ADUPG1_005328, partial [Aduncisulcus paluster]
MIFSGDASYAFYYIDIAELVKKKLMSSHEEFFHPEDLRAGEMSGHRSEESEEEQQELSSNPDLITPRVLIEAFSACADDLCKAVENLLIKRRIEKAKV